MSKKPRVKPPGGFDLVQVFHPKSMKVGAKACHCCDGSGTETDNLKLGRALSGLRLRQQISLRGMARELGISHTYLWQLENGRRNWPANLIKNYRNAL